MKIALFTDADVFAGTERHILDLAVALRAEGCAVEIACPGSGALAQRARAAQLAVYAVEKRRGLDWPAVRALGAKLRSRSIDLIHSHNGRTALIAALAVVLAGRGRTVTTQHFLEPARTTRQGWRGWAGRQLHRTIIQQAAGVVAISDAVRAGILGRGEAAAGKVQRVWNGIADPAATPLLPPGEVRAALGIAQEVPMIVCAARLEPEKLVGDLIEAMPGVLRVVPEAVCVIAGEGRQREGLETQVARAGLGRAVRFVGFQPEVLSLIHAGDLFVLPSAAEPFGLALVEAMALGKPVIATRAGGPLEIIVDGGSGVLVSPHDPPALGQAIVRILTDPAGSCELGRAARTRFETCFTAARMARHMKALYRGAGASA